MTERNENMRAERRAKIAKFDELRAAGVDVDKAAKQAGFVTKSACYSARYEENKLNGTVHRRSAPNKVKPKKSDVIVVNSDDEKLEENVKIVVMKGPSAVIQKIAEALGGVL